MSATSKQPPDCSPIPQVQLGRKVAEGPNNNPARRFTFICAVSHSLASKQSNLQLKWLNLMSGPRSQIMEKCQFQIAWLSPRLKIPKNNFSIRGEES
jgi:hypothetical protein